MEYPGVKSKGVRVRFAPSPTGPVHAGNMRTAVFNWLFARHSGGTFILRMEDTDKERSRPEYVDDIVESLEWLGLDWDEGPLFQSNHSSLYKKMLESLSEGGHVYPCFCTPEQLEEDRKVSLAKSVAPVYSGRCRRIQEDERAHRMKNEPYAVRFKVEGEKLTYRDVIRGDIEVDLRLVGDFVVSRSDGAAVYNLAAAVDDAVNNITHVIRGEDHISNTPRQILIMEALGYDRPLYVHLPLILAQDGTKLSKRHERSAFREIMRGGYMPEAVFNFLSLIGWSSADKKEDMEIAELVEKFSLDRIALRPAQYNLQKLKWLNGQKIRKAPPERLLEVAAEYIRKYEKRFSRLSDVQKSFLMDAVRENIEDLTQLDEALAPFFDYSIEPGIKEAVADYPTEKVIGAFMEHYDTAEFKLLADAVSRKTGSKGKALYMPLRAALFGRMKGPEVKKLYLFLSPDERLDRMKRFMEFLRT